MKKTIGIRIAVCLAVVIFTSETIAIPLEGYSAQAWKIEDGQYVDASGKPIAGAIEKGITVSKYQNRENKKNGGIDWKQVYEYGIKFAMVRVGYFNDPDPYYGVNMKGASENGLKTGVFFYTQALDTQTAIEEANYVLQMVKDYPISYPIAYDVESQYLLDHNLSRKQITENINAFCKVIEEAGYRPIVYANHKWLTLYIDMWKIPYDVWYARYGSVNNCKNRTIWQCTDKGRVDGIDGDVTIEFAFADYDKLIPSEGFKTIDGKRYYTKDYKKQTGWIQTEGNWYYMDSNGVMISNTTMEINDVSYSFGLDGAMIQTGK